MSITEDLSRLLLFGSGTFLTVVGLVIIIWPNGIRKRRDNALAVESDGAIRQKSVVPFIFGVLAALPLLGRMQPELQVRDWVSVGFVGAFAILAVRCILFPANDRRNPYLVERVIGAALVALGLDAVMSGMRIG